MVPSRTRHLVARAAREAVAHYCARITRDGLVTGTAGNLSARDGDLLAITPSGMAYELITPERVCVVRIEDGVQVDGEFAPASELPLHLAALRATGEGAVVHTHSLAATAVASIEGLTELPNIHYYTAMFGGPLRITEYARYGTSELAERVAAALEGRTGALMGQHGAVVVGDDLHQAYDKALVVEWLAQLWLMASQAGTPKILPQEEIDAVMVAIRGYGQRP